MGTPRDLWSRHLRTDSGLTPEPLESPAIDALLSQLVVDGGGAPGASAAVAVHGNDGWHLWVGKAGAVASDARAAVQTSTLYDLASLTKPVTALLCARLVERGVLSFETPLSRLLPEAVGSASAAASVEQLLSHRAGLMAHCEFFEPLRSGQGFDASRALHNAANARREGCTGQIGDQGFAPLYSDLGYLLLGAALTHTLGVELDALVSQEINEPLGLALLSARQWRDRTPFLARVAPTEIVPWRGGLVHGVVHDENAWAFAGEGSAGNAGLFASVVDTTRFGMALLDTLHGRAGHFVSAPTLRRLLLPRSGGTLLAGFDAKAETGSSAGQWFSKHSFGHLGFTGTSLWCDPETQLVAAVLSNRVYPSRDNQKHRQFRPLLADALYCLALGRTGPQ